MRWGWALAECFKAEQSLNAAIVRAGWALAWYHSTGAVLGLRYDDQEEAARTERASMWRGSFVGCLQEELFSPSKVGKNENKEY